MRFFPKTVIAMIMLFGTNPVYGAYSFLSCPQTEQQYQSLLSRQGGSITSTQNQTLLKQCYEEVKRRFEQEVQNRYRQQNQYQSPGMGGIPPMETPGMKLPGMGSLPPIELPPIGTPGMAAPGMENPICPNGLFQGQSVPPNKCLIGQGGEMMEKMMKAFGF